MDLIDHLNSQLITVLVMDDFNEGIPVAWMISNNESNGSLRVFSIVSEKGADMLSGPVLHE